MFSYIDCKKTSDNEVVFHDGYLYIISKTKEACEDADGFHDPEYKVDVIILSGEYDDPITLADIAEKYPKVCKVHYDDLLSGYVYAYGNHGHEKNAEMWELVGKTVGYA